MGWRQPAARHRTSAAHDTTQGIWASDLDLGIRRQAEVASAVAGMFDREFLPVLGSSELEDHAPALDQREVTEIEERLRQLGYL
jgi:hypothetical protein